MTPIIIAAVVYLIVWPLIIRLVCVAHTQVFIKRKQAKLPRSQQHTAALPKPIWPKLKEKLKFTLSDTRPWKLQVKKEKNAPPPTEGVAHKKVFLIIWVLGLAVAVAGAMLGKWTLIPTSFLFTLAAMIFSFSTATPILKQREKMLMKMFNTSKPTLGLQGDTHQGVIQVVEWFDILRPSKIRIEIPDTFNAESGETYFRQWNQNFGQETTWVAFDDPESGKPGWDFAEGELTMRAMPPLPKRADWSEHYVLDPAVAWGFFPIGLGVEDGIELTNPKTGEIENVLGFDVAGLQADTSKAAGMKCSPTITTSPMALAAGGTGGGKALSLDTMVQVIRKADSLDQSSSSKNSTN